MPIRFVFLFVFTFLQTIGAAAAERAGVYIIFDSSNSMWGALSDQSRKYEAARAAMRDLVGMDFDGRDVALRIYGHRRKDDCSDSELVVPWSAPEVAIPEMVARMEAVRPTGRTPIDRSLRAALKDFGTRAGTIILISDGVESCDADPCALVRAWRDRDVDINVHVVGLGLRGKERAAMQCIADAAGTAYRDAFNVDDLVSGLGAAIEAAQVSDKPDPGTPEPAEQVSEARVRLDITTPDGTAQRGQAVFAPTAGGAAITVDTDGRYRVPAGDYVVTAGVLTVGGAVYRPVERRVTVGFDGADMTVVINDAPRPPEVRAVFSMDGAALRETVVTVYRDGAKLGSFHGDTSAFVPEGALEFRTTPAGASREVTVGESFVAGDFKEISFATDTEVRLVVRLPLGQSGQFLLARPTINLFQDGEKVAKLNRSSGGLVRPGSYLLRADDGVNAYAGEITVTSEPEQHLDIELPAALLTVSYVDANGQLEADKRVFIVPERGGKGVTRKSGEAIALLPGAYVIRGHPKSAGYPEVPVILSAGQEGRIELRATR